MSSFSISRNQSGQAQIEMKNVKNKELDNIGKVSGSLTLTIGNTGQSSDETVVQIGQTKDDDALLIAVDDDIDNIEFYGTNLEARFNSKTAKQYNVQWDAKNSVLDSSAGSGSLLVTTNEKSSNNTFILGKAGEQQALFSDSSVDNMIVDNGRNNTFISNANSANYFETTETSRNARIFGGNGDNTFMLNGDEGLVVGGSGNDLFFSGKTAERNLIFGMDGNDFLNDYGSQNFFSGGQGVDALETHGSNGLFNLGADESYNAKIGKGSDGNIVFAAHEFTDSNGNTYSYDEYIKKYLDENNISLEEFKTFAGLSNVVTAEEICRAMLDR